ncbi:MAG: radical SAM protein [Candidatus Lokiarchaeota archaeon]|nr:radical SAM protein [Candidatus Lokiarchaeota archaeon]
MIKMIKNIMELSRVNPKLIKIFIPWVFKSPRYLISIFRLLNSYKKNEKIRESEELKGIMIPPVLIISITSQCNLRCAGCYAVATGTVSKCSTYKKNIQQQLKSNKWIKIISEATKLGVFSFIIAGGEPFLFPDLLDICRKFKDRFFLIFTNGTALKEKHFKKLKQIANVAVIVSLEGGPRETDSRRGRGVFKKALKTVQHLQKIGTLTGISTTITRTNYRYWIDKNFIKSLNSLGIRIAFFIEYIPTDPNDHSLILTPAERSELRSHIIHYRRNNPIFIIHSPGDEEFLGGCVSAGRGFAHITPEGDLTPCPVSNIATHNLTKSSLREGLKSVLFKEIREKDHLLETEGMPCALFSHPKEVNEIARAIGAYRTDTRKKVT